MTQLPQQENTLRSHEAPALHRGVQVLGEQGVEGRKAFFIQIEARPGHEEAVVQMLQDIRACVEDEPATGPWFAVRFSQTSFAIFEAFPDLAGRQAHVEGGGGDIFRDVTRMNAILADAAKVHRVDVLMSKDLFSHR
jgi:quinol monooxygenase YgiN